MDYEYDSRYGQPVIKDGCGIFAVLRKKNAPKISNLAAVNGISCIKYRGSDLGAGYASFDASLSKGPYRLKAFVKNRDAARNLERNLQSRLGSHFESRVSMPGDSGSRKRFGIWEASIDSQNLDDETLEIAVDRTNLLLLGDRTITGRIFSYGKCLNVYKEVGYPLEVAELCGLDRDLQRADLWIAHTRQPTNSPGAFPIWSHPFASGECAIVHNGDISSFGANIEQLSSWGVRSHVGTDSEVIARLLDHLVRVEGLSFVQAATVLTNPFERNVSSEVMELLRKYRGARLDGPFAVVAGYSIEGDTYLIALTDRSKFRPILIAEDENNYYVASEENQIRNLSKKAKIWTPDPGSFFIASVNNGVISKATTRNIATQENILRSVIDRRAQSLMADETSLDATGKSFREINEFIASGLQRGLGQVSITNANGQRYIGIGISLPKSSEVPFKITIDGFPGNCLANLNSGAVFEVFGNAADDVADTMHEGKVVVHGNVRDVAGQALQGGSIFVRGCVGNRAGIQMREYGTRRPYLLVGETADDYLGEYMAGGVVAVLNISNSERPVGNYVGTGMVGGMIFIRGKTKESQIALLPQREDVLNYLRAALADDMIAMELYYRISLLDYPSEKALSELLPEWLFSRLRFLYFSGKYNKPMSVEYRKLSPSELELLSEKLGEFSRTFGLTASIYQEILDSEYTIIRTKEEKAETPVPPQEVPVEE
ncbi:MAG: GltB/FmdC/FwdC-like GXGXG domain-containing protein [Nitrososphaerales archaeon]